MGIRRCSHLPLIIGDPRLEWGSEIAPRPAGLSIVDHPAGSQARCWRGLPGETFDGLDERHWPMVSPNPRKRQGNNGDL
jgi:hypothetical protein